MIRLRHNNGTVTEVHETHFVEICDLEGRVAAVAYLDPAGVTHVNQADSTGMPMLRKYAETFKDVQLAPVIGLPVDHLLKTVLPSSSRPS